MEFGLLLEARRFSGVAMELKALPLILAAGLVSAAAAEQCPRLFERLRCSLYTSGSNCSAALASPCSISERMRVTLLMGVAFGENAEHP